MSVTEESPTQHTIRAWLENTLPLYQEVERIAARDNRPVARVTAVKGLVTEVLYGLNGMSSLRHLYRKAYGEGSGPDWRALDKFRDGFTRAEFDNIDWDVLTRDLTEGM